MAFILTFLGKGDIDCTTVAIATAKKYALLGKKVLLVQQNSSPLFSLQLGETVTNDVSEISPNLSVIQLQSSKLLENLWEKIKELESKYLRSPIINNIFAQELGLLPGMDSALALNYLREQDESNNYDVIIFDGNSGFDTLRMFGIPDIASWYIRRVRNLLENSDIVKTLSPFVQPVTSAVLNVSWSAENFVQQPTDEANQILEKGKKAIHNPARVCAFLVTNSSSSAIAHSKYLWGSAQQVNLTVGGVLVNQNPITETLSNEFKPLNVVSIPTLSSDNWNPLIEALPDFQAWGMKAPSPVEIDTQKREVKIFLPGFEKKQVKLSQSGPEITISAGDQRRNIALPSPLKGQSVKGAKFEDAYLIISL